LKFPLKHVIRCEYSLTTHFHDKEDDEDDDSSDEGEQAEEKTFAGPLAIDTPMAFGPVRV